MVRAVRRKQACFLTTHTRNIHVPTDTNALMHLSMRCPTTPTSGVYWGNIGLLSRGLVHRGGAFVTRVLNDGHKSVMAICVRVILVRPDKKLRKIWSGGPKSLTKLSRYFGPGGPKSTTCFVLCDSISSNETSERNRLQTRRVSLSEQALIQVFSKQLVFLLQHLVQCILATCTLCYYNPWFCCLHSTIDCCLHASMSMILF